MHRNIWSSKIIILGCWMYCTSIPFFTVMLLICETFMRYGPSLDPLCALPVFVYALPTGMQEFSSLYPFFWPWRCWHYSDSPCFLLLWSLSSDHIPLSAVLKWIQSLKFHLLINAKCICVIKQSGQPEPWPVVFLTVWGLSFSFFLFYLLFL